MKQPVTTTVPSLIHLGGLIAGGLFELGAGLGLETTDHDEFTTQLTDLVMKNGLHQQGKQERATRSAALKTAAKNCTAFLRLTRDVMKPVLGYQYSQAWNALGFMHRLYVPTKAAAFNPMVQAVRDYLTAHPTAEIAPMNITAANATALLNAFTAAQQALAAQELVLKTAANSRDASAAALRKATGLLIAELTTVLPAVDPRWARFGLNQPGMKQRPPTPTGLQVSLFGTNGLSVKWEAAPRAAYYRVWVKIDGVDQEAAPVGSPSDLDFLIENLPSNKVVEVAVSAVNNGGESAKTEFITIQTL